MSKTKAANRKNKGSKVENLHSRFARDTITGADHVSRTMNNYAKNSPYKAASEGGPEFLWGLGRAR